MSVHEHAREHTRLLVTATILLAATAGLAVVAFVVNDAAPGTGWTLWVLWFTPLWILPLGLLLALDVLAWATRGVAPRVSWVAAGIVLGTLVALGGLVAVVLVVGLLA